MVLRLCRSHLFRLMMAVLVAFSLCPQPIPRATAAPAQPSALLYEIAWTFVGRVYEGYPGETDMPVEGLRVCATFGAGEPTARCTETDADGWWGLPVYDNEDGYPEYYLWPDRTGTYWVSTGAESTGGVAIENWEIRYLAPVDPRRVFGNNFWVISLPAPSATHTPTPQPTRTRTPTPTPSPTPEYRLTGHVYEGNVGDTSTPFDSTLLSLWCGNQPEYPSSLIGFEHTDANGEYGLWVEESCPYYFIYLQVAPPYEPVGAQSTGGEVQEVDWIRYTTPLAGQVLSGNDFWVQAFPTSTPTLTLTRTPSPTPAYYLSGHIYHGAVGDTSRPLSGMTVYLQVGLQPDLLLDYQPGATNEDGEPKTQPE